MPSATGCSSPYGPTMLGSFRSCIYPRIFRSIRAKKTTVVGIIYMSGDFKLESSIFIVGEGR